MKKAIIVGDKGQDGFYLSQHLIAAGYQVYGINRDSKTNILNAKDVMDLLSDFNPSEIYYLAAFHHSAEQKQGNISQIWENSHNVHVKGILNFLSSIVDLKLTCHIFYASSSLIFSDSENKIVDESSAFKSSSVYGQTKIMGMELIKHFRTHYGVFACSGILFNHESPRRGDHFLSQKIINAAVRAQHGDKTKLILGDIEAENDWGSAQDYVSAMHTMLNAEMPKDYIIATGKLLKVKDFVSIVYRMLGLDWEMYIQEDASLLHRKVKTKLAITNQILNELSWKPTINFETWVKEMILAKGGVLVD